MHEFMRTAKKLLFSVAKGASYFISPPACSYCAVFLFERSVFCDNCRAHIAPLAITHLEITATYRVPVIAVSNYEQPLRTLILSKNSMSIVPSRQLGQLIWQITYLNERKIDFFIPIPLHWTRYSWRGFNQAEEIAKELSMRSGKPLAQILARIRRTQLQSALSADEREHNVKEVFAFVGNAELYRGKHLVVVDDLLTTGSTMKEAIKVLRDLHPASITVVVACRVV